MCMIDRWMGTFVDDTRVQLDGDRSSDNFTQETAGISRVAGGFGCWAFAIGGHGDEGGGGVWISDKRLAMGNDRPSCILLVV
jgi:hypothetical protein